jgi:hypothetical protein
VADWFEIAPLALTVLYEGNVDKCARFFGLRRSRHCGTALKSSPREESVRLADADMSAHSKSPPCDPRDPWLKSPASGTDALQNSRLFVFTQGCAVESDSSAGALAKEDVPSGKPECAEDSARYSIQSIGV